jgi:hypothetical protein
MKNPATSTIIRLLRQHDAEWFIDDEGEPVFLEHLQSFTPSEDKLHGVASYLTEMHRLRSIKETLIVLGY